MAPEGVVVDFYERVGKLPHFNPDDDTEPLHPEVADLRARLGAADALLVSTPEYAGALPGSFKNLLDWTVGGGTYGMPVAWINTSPSATGAADAHDSLRKVLTRTGTEIVDAACAHIPVPRDAVGPDNLIADPEIREQLSSVLARLATHAGKHPRDEAARAG